MPVWEARAIALGNLACACREILNYKRMDVDATFFFLINTKARHDTVKERSYSL